jgi:hypothetical protein
MAKKKQISKVKQKKSNVVNLKRLQGSPDFGKEPEVLQGSPDFGKEPEV